MAFNYSFMGEVSNDEILDYYSNNSVDCFISTSSSEGLPVSVMEAMSYGIPIIVTDVGGTSELLRENGILLPENTDTNEIADAIEKLLFCDESQKREMSKQSERLWREKFDAKENAIKLVNRLKKSYLNKRNMVIVTNGYPFGGEQSFVEEEIKELIKEYNLIIITIVDQPISEKEVKTKINDLLSKCDITENIEKKLFIYPCFMEYKTIYFIKYIAKYVFDPFINDERKLLLKDKNNKIEKQWESIKYYIKTQLFLDWLSKNRILEKCQNNFIAYTYWYLYTTLAFSIIKNRNKDVILITRAHGYDLYNERMIRTKRQPFREVMNKYLDNIFFICKKGKEYYCNNWKDVNKEKLDVLYIGSRNKKINQIRKEKKENQYTIVSCSNLIQLKRVDMIIDAIGIVSERHPQCDFQWIHFGNGKLREELEERAKQIININN